MLTVDYRGTNLDDCTFWHNGKPDSFWVAEVVNWGSECEQEVKSKECKDRIKTPPMPFIIPEGYPGIFRPDNQASH